MPLEQELELETESPAPEGAVSFSREELEEPDEPQLQPGQQASDPDLLDRRGRRSWIKETKAEKEQLKQELQREREERQNERLAFERRLATIEGRASAPSYQQQNQPSEAEQEVAYYQQQMDAATAAVQHAAPGTPMEVLRQHQANYQQAQRNMVAAIARAAVPQQQQQQPGMSVEAQMLKTQFPQIFADDALRLEAQAEAIRISKQTGKPFSYAIAAEANQRVLQRHGIGQPRPAPSPAARAKLASVPGRAGASGGGSGGISLDSNQRKTAIAYCNTPGRAHLSEREKYKIFAREVLSDVE